MRLLSRRWEERIKKGLYGVAFEQNSVLSVFFLVSSSFVSVMRCLSLSLSLLYPRRQLR
jgi:hypothetical protein